ncbi:GGDEF domain-containing protein [Brucella sp. BE17]|uniref:GGDEF domain-containing protein n=1 Tax=Brucella sp. BE17 TaxID=3142977 RepID=UPI0031BB57FB
MKLPSKNVLKRTITVTLIAAAISISVSTGIRYLIGAQADTVTIIVRIILPFVIAIPLALVWFTRMEKLDTAYRKLVRHANELARTASVDPLTGVLNRRSFIEQFNGAMLINVRGWFLIADIDYLKKINDRYGHLTGDDAVISVASALQNELPEDSLIARIGGDEFCAFVPKGASKNLDPLVQRLNIVAGTIFSSKRKDVPHKLTMSAGYTICRPKQTFEELMAVTDENLYRKKRERLPLVA